MKHLIEKLASKELSFGCEVTFGSDVVKKLIQKNRKEWWRCLLPDGLIVRCKEESFSKILGHQIYIGDILERIGRDYHKDLLIIWEPCGLSNSLQTIAEESGYEEVAECECKSVYHIPPSPAYESCWELHRHIVVQRLKSGPARKLEAFITSIL